MIKGRELLGRHVVDLNTGERIDSVRDIVFDHGANLVLGLMVAGSGKWWQRREQPIPFSAVYSVGEDAVMVTSAQDMGTPEEQARLHEVMKTKINLIGMPLMSESGEALGRIHDVAFDEYSGQVTAYEVAGGPFAQQKGGLDLLPYIDAVQVNGDKAILPAALAEELRRNQPAAAPEPAPEPSPAAPSEAGPLDLGEYERQAAPTPATSVRPIRARPEQITHSAGATPAPPPEPGLLDRLRGLLDSGPHEDPQERELLQVHEERGAPVRTAAPEPAPVHTAHTDPVDLSPVDINPIDIDLTLDLAPLPAAPAQPETPQAGSIPPAQKEPEPSKPEPSEPEAAQTAAPDLAALNRAIERIVQGAYGKPAGRTVQAASGEVVVQAGETITPEVVAAARRLGLLRELLAAAGTSE